jgi:predicted XRE-type DNA-binding protein
MKSYSSPFELLSDDADEISNLKLKANMMIAIRSLIERKGWSQSDAARELGVSQPRISNLKNGKIDKFSVDMLMELLVKLGFKFEFNYTPIENSSPKISMNVAAV